MKASFQEEVKQLVADLKVGYPQEDNQMGPLVADKQYDSVQCDIQTGMDEGATVLIGGNGKPEGLTQDYFAKPTVFKDVRNDMRIAQEEIFGPVTTIITYETLDEAI